MDVRKERKMNTYSIVMMVYVVVVIGIGFFASRYVHGISDFLVGGRKFNSGLLFITLISANIGAGSTVGVAGLGGLQLIITSIL